MIKRTLLAFSLFIISLPCYAQESPRTAGLYGCPYGDLAQTPDGTYQFITCGSAPKAFYYSTDFGAHWTFGAGGDYQHGYGGRIGINSSSIYMFSDYGVFYKASLPSGSSWSPNWTKIIDSSSTYDFRVSNSAIYSMESDTIKVYNAATGALLQALPYTATGTWGSVALTSSAFFMQNGRSLYKYDIQPGSTLAAGVEILPLGAGWRPVRLTEGPGNSIFVTLTTLDGSEGRVLSSPDNGGSFNTVSTSIVDFFHSSCWAGSTIIVGNLVTRNGGTSWVRYNYGRTISGSVDVSLGHCIIDPRDSNRVMSTILRGPVTATDYTTNTDPSWTDKSSGLEAISVLQIAQNQSAKNKVIAKTNGGIASTADFLSSTPTWYWSCGGDDMYCSSYASVTADRAETGIFYSSNWGSIYKGTMDASGLTSWSLLSSGSDGDGNRIVMSPHFSQTLIVPRQAVDGTMTYTTGSITFHSAMDGSLTKEVFEGHPVRSVIITSPTVFYASVTLGADAQKGIYRTTDGGTTWTRLTHPLVTGRIAKAEIMTYDSVTGTLWAFLSINEGSADSDWRLVYLLNATTSSSSWREAPLPILTGSQEVPPTALATDPRGGRLYLAGGVRTYVTPDFGVTWLLLYSDPLNTMIYELLFDDLLVASNTGLIKLPQPSCSLTISRYNGRAVKLPKNFTFKVSYSGRYTSGKIQYRLSATRAWQTLKQVTFTNHKASSKRRITRGMQLRTLMTDCASSVKTIKKARARR